MRKKESEVRHMNIILRIVLFPLLIILGIMWMATEGIASAVNIIAKPLAFVCLIGTVAAFFMLNVPTGCLFAFITLLIYLLPEGIDVVAAALFAMRDGLKETVY